MIKNTSLLTAPRISSSTKLCAVIGKPISHSLSPLIHNRWYHDHSIDAVYLALPVDSGKVKKVIDTLHNIGARGVNITLPHKIEALQACGRLTEIVKKIGATNSVIFRESEIIGDNTDSEGFYKDLCAHQRSNSSSQGFCNRVCLWGAGGAAQAVLHALLNLRAKEVLIINRTLDRGKKMVEKVRGEVGGNFRVVSSWLQEKKFVADCDLFINATSLGMKKNSVQKTTSSPRVTKLDQCSEDKNTQKQEHFFPKFSQIVKNPEQALAYDLVYNPIDTEFLKCARKANMKTASGIGMLVAQAAISFEDWFGISPITSQKNYDGLIKQLVSYIEKTL